MSPPLQKMILNGIVHEDPPRKSDPTWGSSEKIGLVCPRNAFALEHWPQAVQDDEARVKAGYKHFVPCDSQQWVDVEEVLDPSWELPFLSIAEAFTEADEIDQAEEEVKIEVQANDDSANLIEWIMEKYPVQFGLDVPAETKAPKVVVKPSAKSKSDTAVVQKAAILNCKVGTQVHHGSSGLAREDLRLRKNLNHQVKCQKRMRHPRSLSEIAWYNKSTKRDQGIKGSRSARQPRYKTHRDKGFRNIDWLEWAPESLDTENHADPWAEEDRGERAEYVLWALQRRSSYNKRQGPDDYLFPTLLSPSLIGIQI